MRAAGLPRLTPHDLRHTAASLAISAGANVKAVQRMLGHASAAMTLDTYSGLFPDDLDSVAAALHEAATAPNVVNLLSRRAEKEKREARNRWDINDPGLSTRAETVGFEPTDGLPRHGLSRAAH